jgi:hypothetical protein
VLLLNVCLLLLAYISLSTQSGNFWIHPRICVLRKVWTEGKERTYKGINDVRKKGRNKGKSGNKKESSKRQQWWKLSEAATAAAAGWRLDPSRPVPRVRQPMMATGRQEIACHTLLWALCRLPWGPLLIRIGKIRFRSTADSIEIQNLNRHSVYGPSRWTTVSVQVLQEFDPDCHANLGNKSNDNFKYNHNRLLKTEVGPSSETSVLNIS